MKAGKILSVIEDEVCRAEELYPTWPENVVEAVAIMAEESGEAVKAANDVRWFKDSVGELQKELVQTAAMCVRCLINLEIKMIEEDGDEQD